MKKILSLTAASYILISLYSCGSTNTPQVGKSVDPEADLGDAKHYGWVSNIDEIPNDSVHFGSPSAYLYNTDSSRVRIKEAINYEMEAHGIKMLQDSADLVVSYVILEKPDSLRTTDGFVELWGQQIMAGESTDRTPVEPGTLIVNLTDTKTGKMAWQGFASGILKPGDIQDQAKIRQAVSSIFSTFRFDNIGSGKQEVSSQP